MRLIITDDGLIWNKDNPFLKKYKDIVLMVCFDRKPETSEYEYLVVPKARIGLGMDPIGADSWRFQALSSVADKLDGMLGYHDDIVFLTDCDPTTLYPYHALKDIDESNNFHLVAMPPLFFEQKWKKEGSRALLSDLSKLDSILYYDINEKFKEVDKSTKFNEFLEYVTNDLGNMMPRFLNRISRMFKTPCYFDFGSKEYILLKEGFDSIDITKQKSEEEEDIDFPLRRSYCTLGFPIPPIYPKEGDEIKETTERLVARVDGKEICNMLRKQRILLAEANGIDFESEECPSIGPCAGTCQKCDAEAAYLRDEMGKIPENERIYPQFDPAKEENV